MVPSIVDRKWISIKDRLRELLPFLVAFLGDPAGGVLRVLKGRFSRADIRQLIDKLSHFFGHLLVAIAEGQDAPLALKLGPRDRL